MPPETTGLASQLVTQLSDESLARVLIRCPPWQMEAVLKGIPDDRLEGIRAALGNDQRRNPCRVRRLIGARLRGRERGST